MSSVGLLQVRTDSGFGSVCGMNQAAGDVVCKQMGMVVVRCYIISSVFLERFANTYLCLGFAHGSVSNSPCTTFSFGAGRHWAVADLGAGGG